METLRNTNFDVPPPFRAGIPTTGEIMSTTNKAVIVDKYAELRDALDQTCHALLIDDPDTIRALLAERDALREALEIARDFVAEALAQERDAYRGHEAVSDIADIEHCLEQIDAALAQGEVWAI